MDRDFMTIEGAVDQGNSRVCSWQFTVQAKRLHTAWSALTIIPAFVLCFRAAHDAEENPHDKGNCGQSEQSQYGEQNFHDFFWRSQSVIRWQRSVVVFHYSSNWRTCARPKTGRFESRGFAFKR